MKTTALAEASAVRRARGRKDPPRARRETLRECIVLRDPTDCLLEAYDCVARCAYANFLARDPGAAGALDDWLGAEREILLGLSVHIQQSPDFVYAMTTVPGATASRISVGIESRWLVILAHAVPLPPVPVIPRTSPKRTPSDLSSRATAGNFRAEARVDEDRFSPRHVCILELPASVDATRSIAVLADGLLAIRMPKVARDR